MGNRAYFLPVIMAQQANAPLQEQRAVPKCLFYNNKGGTLMKAVPPLDGPP